MIRRENNQEKYLKKNIFTTKYIHIKKYKKLDFS